MSDFASDHLGSNPKPATKKGVILQKNIFRLCPLIAIFAVLLLSLSPMKVSAAMVDFDYTDYIVSDSYQDGQNHLQVRIPLSEFQDAYWSIYENQTGSYKFIKGQVGAALYMEVAKYMKNENNPLMVDFFAFKGGDYLSLSDIPSGSELTLEYKIKDYEGSYPDFSCNWVINYYDASHELISTVNTPQVLGDFVTNAVTIEIDKPTGAMYMTCSVRWRNLSLLYTDGYLDLSVSAFVFDLSIDAMLREQQETGKTNKLLQEVSDALNETIPGADQSIDKSESAQDKLDQVGDALESVTKPAVGDIDISIENYVTPEASEQISSFFQAFWGSHFFTSMLTIVLTIGTASYILFGKR